MPLILIVLIALPSGVAITAHDKVELVTLGAGLQNIKVELSEEPAAVRLK